MENWLKGLIAAACIVVVAGGAFFAWEKVVAKSNGDQLASAAHCQRVYDDIKRLNSYQKMQDFSVDQIKDEQQRCDQLLGVKR